MWQSILMSVATGILKMAMPMITTGLRKMIIKSIEEWEVYANETSYNWDNLVVKALHGILCITDEQTEPKTEEFPDLIAPGT
jgi:hypothetical protein